MIPVNTFEEFQRWLESGSRRRPSLYGGILKGGQETPTESNVEPIKAITKTSHKPWMPPPPPKDFKSAASGEYEEVWDGAGEYDENNP